VQRHLWSAVLGLTAAAFLSGVAFIGCVPSDGSGAADDDSHSDDDDNDNDNDNDNDDGSPDDDDDDDDDASPDDDDDNDDDTTSDDDASPTADCETVAGDVYTRCGIALKDATGAAVDLAGTIAWCKLSEQLFGGDNSMKSPFWNCLDDCANGVHGCACDPKCFYACEAPADPGGSGCGHTVYGIYTCGVEFDFTGTNYWIPEMDEMAVCTTDGRNWSCDATCVADDVCSDPPTGPQTQTLDNCVNNCG